MKRGYKRWLREISKYKVEIIYSLVFFVISGVTFLVIGRQLDSRESVVVPDLILDNLPVLKIAGPIFVIGIFFYIFCLVGYPLLFKVKDLARTIEHFALLVMIRNLFMPLISLGSRPEAVEITFPWIINNWNFHNDLFFSGHVAIPLLGFFIFREKKVRIFFLLGSIIMGLSALLTHLHYSIDVFAGIFIAYGSFKFGEWVFGYSKNKG